jgi:Xaa-Pro aminopeptidase
MGMQTPPGKHEIPRRGSDAWRNFSDRIIQPGDIVFMDLAALTWNGYKSCYYRTYCVGKEPTKEQKDTYATALEWLYNSIHAVKAGTTTREIAKKWPSAKEAWGYKEEDQAAANLWGHGLGLAQYDPPVITGRSTIRSRSRPE